MSLTTLRRWGTRIRRRCRLVTVILFICTFITFGIIIEKNSKTSWRDLNFEFSTTLPSPVVLNPEQLRQVFKSRRASKGNAGPNSAELRMQWLRERIERTTRRLMRNSLEEEKYAPNIPSYNIHIFYYGWYENPAVDKQWQHWNHEYIPSWKADDKKAYPSGRHHPPLDIGSNFYPELGCYSSRDLLVINTHMRLLKDAGVGVLVVSWYPPDMSDGSSKSPDSLFPILLDAALKYNLTIAPHIEPYKDRNPANFRHYLLYFLRAYGNHTALCRMKRNKKLLPVVYVYDSYRTPAADWRELLGERGSMSVRGTEHDAVFLSLFVDMQHRHDIKRAHFDGFYTYFASNGFSYGSTWKNWKQLSRFANEEDLVFVPSVGPGYIDTRVRPWNVANTRHRRRGAYYEVAWRAALAAKTSIVSITSFNEWHEGTQIEPAKTFATPEYQYLDYEPDSPMFYMNLSRRWVKEFLKQNNNTL